MVKCGDWGCTPNPYSSHINIIYIEGGWQPLYAVHVHMDVFPPRYGCSCWLSLWNFVRNLGYSHAISHGEMRWLRLHTHPIFISHQCYIYKRCLTTFICCGCAYGRVPTMLWFLMPTKLLEFCQKSGLLPRNKSWWNAGIEAAHLTHTRLTSMLYTYKVFDILYMLWMCIWMCPLHVMVAHADLAFGILLEIWATPTR
jgi:hypothetical protein